MPPHTTEQRIPTVRADELQRLRDENATLRGTLLAAADHARITAKWLDEQSMPIAASFERDAAVRWTAAAEQKS